MKVQKNKFYKVLSVFLAILLTVSTVPFAVLTVSAEEPSATIADPVTMNDWKEYFGASDEISTEFAGGVWTDKSVIAGNNLSSVSGLPSGITVGKDNFGNDNFLIALSAIASTKEVKGYSVSPTDTMFVLDLSNSMDDAKCVPTMVAAANDAIKTLLSLNKHNRVGVVVYSGNTSASSAATTSTATLLLNLGRYTAPSSGDYITCDVSNSDSYNTFVRTSTGLKYENGTAVTSVSKETNGAAYMQNGIYKAYQQLINADTTIPAGQVQAGTARIPIMVLMSNGAPSIGTSSFNNVNSSNIGNGTGSSDKLTFAAQLTAAFSDAHISEHYGKDMLFYTLGMNTYSDQAATGVLSPSASSNTVKGYWTSYLNSTGSSVTVDGTTFSKDSLIKSMDYVTKYHSARNSSQLTSAFKEIVNQIIIQSRYYATLVDSSEHDFDGYVDFTDEIGSYMEVKDIKGIQISENEIYTGAEFASHVAFCDFIINNSEPDEEDYAIINTVARQLGIASSQVVALFKNAVAEGQIYYNTTTGAYNNYVAYYETEDHEYISPYIDGEAPPENAAFVSRDYLYLGQETLSHAASDMLYTMVRVSQSLSDGRQILDFYIPASLIPTITYEVILKDNTSTVTNETLKSVTNDAEGKHPVRLLFEVGLDSDINPVNIKSVLASSDNDEDFRRNDDGTYTFYTNRWRDDEGNATTAPSVSSVNGDFFDQRRHYTTTSYFNPSVQNERYYYIEDTVVYVDEDCTTPLMTAPSAGTAYYRQFNYIVGNEYGAWVESKSIRIAQNTLDSEYLQKNDDGVYYIKVGALYEQIDRFHLFKGGNDGNDRPLKNLTETFDYSDYPIISSQGAYHVLCFLGNNGKLTVSPTSGIALTKEAVSRVAVPEEGFLFEIQIRGTSYPSSVLFTDENGADIKDDVNGTYDADKGLITVNLDSNQTVYISGIDAGTECTITEIVDANGGYMVADIIGGNADGDSTTVTVPEISDSVLFAPVKYINSEIGYGTLIVSKDVEHPFDVLPDAMASKYFTVIVELEGALAKNAFYTAPSGKIYPTEVDGKENTYRFTLSLNDGHSLTIENIADGVKYTVTEPTEDMHPGFSLNEARSYGLEGTIDTDLSRQAHLVNTYAPEIVEFDIEIDGTKTVVGAGYDEETFTFVLEQYIDATSSYMFIQKGTVTINGKALVGDDTETEKAYHFPAQHISFDALGTYRFRIREQLPEDETPGMTYDSTVATFEVTVTDVDLDGKLEAKLSENSDHMSITDDGNHNYIIHRDFTNFYKAHSTHVDIPLKKVLVNTTGVEISLTGFSFGLYETDSEGNAVGLPIYVARPGAAGVATMRLPITDSAMDGHVYILKEIVPNTPLAGMTYDETEYEVTLSVTTNGESGELEADITITEKDSGKVTDAVFTNEFDLHTSSSITIGGQKTLYNKTLDENMEFEEGDFKFAIFQTDSTFEIIGSGNGSYAYVNADGTFEFDPLSYDKIGTHYYIAGEMISYGGAIAYDQTKYLITVVVSYDEATGTLIASPHVVKLGGEEVGTHELNFVNVYEINDSESVTISGNKVLLNPAHGNDTTYARPLIANEFEFILTQTESDFETAVVNGLSATAKNRADGTYIFDTLNYTVPGTYYYTVKENVPTDKKGISYDETVYQITVNVTDNGDGTLSKEVLYSKDGQRVSELNFENSYRSEMKTSLTLEGIKSLEGRDLLEGEFTFALFETDSTFSLPDTALPIASTVNGENGKYSFSLFYEDGEEGKHYYVLEELIPADRKGVHYDTRQYLITVHVIDNGEGVLYAYTQITSAGTNTSFAHNELHFGNIYTAESAEIIIDGEKTLIGKDLENGEFKFLLYHADANNNIEDGTTPYVAYNDADGTFTFKTLTFKDAGVYHFVIAEDTTLQAESVIFDETKYHVTIEVVDNGEGKLVASDPMYTVVGSGNPVDVPTFENIYDNTVTPPNPPTGEDNAFTAWIMLLVLSATGLTAIAKRTKKARSN